MKIKKSIFEYIFLFVVLFIILFPAIIIILLAVTSGNSWTLHPKSLTMRWILEFFANREWIFSFYVSFIVAILTAIFCLVLGTTSALYVYLNPQSRISRFLTRIQSTMLVLPDVLVGTTILGLFSFFKASLGFISLIVASTTSFSSFSYVIVLSKLNEMDEKIIDAAKDLGASMFDIVHRILLPFCSNSFIASIILIMGMSLDDVVISYFTGSGDVKPFTLYLYNSFKYGKPIGLIVASAFLIVAILIFSVLGFFVLRFWKGTFLFVKRKRSLIRGRKR